MFSSSTFTHIVRFGSDLDIFYSYVWIPLLVFHTPSNLIKISCILSSENKTLVDDPHIIYQQSSNVINNTYVLWKKSIYHYLFGVEIRKKNRNFYYLFTHCNKFFVDCNKFFRESLKLRGINFYYRWILSENLGSKEELIFQFCGPVFWLVFFLCNKTSLIM